jgi:RNA polymerase sigma-70 factor, ECF subfamily
MLPPFMLELREAPTGGKPIRDRLSAFPARAVPRAARQRDWRSLRAALPWSAVSSPDASAEPPAPAVDVARQGGLGGPRGSSPEASVEAADSALIARMARGDRSAIAALYERHVSCLLSLGQSLLRDRREAEDLIHDVFLEAWRHCADYSAERGTVRTWLLIRTRSRALDRLKSARPRQTESADLERIEGARSTADADAHALLGDQQRLRQTLSQMPEAQQQVILLGYFEGLSTTEMATRLGIPAGTVKSRTRAALSTLRNLLSVRDE